MLYRMLEVKKKTRSKTLSVTKASKEKLMLLSKCEVCHTKSLRFAKEQKASEIYKK